MLSSGFADISFHQNSLEMLHPRRWGENSRRSKTREGVNVGRKEEIVSDDMRQRGKGRSSRGFHLTKAFKYNTWIMVQQEGWLELKKEKKTF